MKKEADKEAEGRAEGEQWVIGQDLDVGEGGGQLVKQQVDARVSKRWRRGETCSQGRNKISLGNTLRQDWSEQSVHSSF